MCIIKTDTIYNENEELDEVFVVEETFEDYKRVTEKLLDRIPAKEWLAREEPEAVANFEDFFVLVDRKQRNLPEESRDKVENTHQLGFVKDQTIKNLRCLDGRHLKMLKKMESYKIDLAKSLNINATDINTYLHYLPSVNILHVHYTHWSNLENYQHYFMHRLRQVIENIELRSDYYQTVRLFPVPQGADIKKIIYYKLFDRKTGKMKENAEEILEKKLLKYKF
ncbi:MAG: hypothetical protein MHMPM18_003887 [Marteilia pararefringens]